MGICSGDSGPITGNTEVACVFGTEDKLPFVTVVSTFTFEAPAARGLALGSMLWLRSVLRVRPRAISVPLTQNCTELAALDAICRGLSVWNYVRKRFRIPLSPPNPL